MKHTLYICILLVSHFCFSQNKETDQDIFDALEKATDTASILLVKKIRGYEKYTEFIPSVNPLNPKKLKRFSSKFGRRFHPISKKYKQHLGLDISATVGTPIHAAATGIILKTETSTTGCGNSVKIQHAFGFTTRYCHMYLFVVKKDIKVSKGDVIGFVGSTGASTGPHLHYEVKKNGKLVDPYPYCFLNL